MAGCGCKNKGNQTPPPQQSQNNSTPVQGQQTNNQSVQESIRKVVEKYYKKK
jgi:hypothetical protein